MKSLAIPGALILLPIWTACAESSQSPNSEGRIQLALDTSESEAVLSILEKRAAGISVSDTDWQRLFGSKPYLRLKAREAALHRDFTDDEFKTFILSPGLAHKATELRRTLDAWKGADLNAAARSILPYLPAQARIRAKVYPVIKPKTNSFVFETATDPTIFLYLDPSVSGPQFENTVAHEMHHIGYASIGDDTDALLKDLPPQVKAAAEWIGGFGEGFAMLAAAGGPEVHPRATSKAEDRARWDDDMANFNVDLKVVESFFLDVIHQKLKKKEEIDAKAFSFFGVQGLWYTVGYRMAVVIENCFGRAILVECMRDLRRLLPTYNKAAAELNLKGGEPLALWSQELLSAMEGKKP